MERTYLLEYSEYEDDIGDSVHQDFIFGPYNFQLLILCQSRNIANVQNVAVLVFRVFLARGQTRV